MVPAPIPISDWPAWRFVVVVTSSLHPDSSHARHICRAYVLVGVHRGTRDVAPLIPGRFPVPSWYWSPSSTRPAPSRWVKEPAHLVVRSATLSQIRPVLLPETRSRDAGRLQNTLPALGGERGSLIVAPAGRQARSHRSVRSTSALRRTDRSPRCWGRASGSCPTR